MLAGLVFTALAIVWVPWLRVHPNDFSLREGIGYAPLWSHRFDGVPGAHVDWTSLLINVVVIWIICGAAALMLKMSTGSE